MLEAMASKRAYSSQGGGAAKKHRQQSYRDNSSTQIDQTYGQRSAFGNIEIITTVPNGDSDLDCEDDTAALAYLQTVRTQASAIPHVIVASKAGPSLPPKTLLLPTNGLDSQDERKLEGPVDRSIYVDGTGDFRGYYQDGAYIAYPPGYFDKNDGDDEDEEEEERDYQGDDQQKDSKEKHAEGENIEMDCGDDDDDESSLESSEGGPRNSNVDEIREAYFKSLINQFLSLCAVLQTEPPADLVSSLPKSNPVEVGGFGPRSDTFEKWSGRLRGTDPLPAQVAGMHKDGALRLLRIVLGGKFLRKNQELRERTSRWLWALLARLPDRGQLDYQEIGYVRELGKRAVLLMLGLAEAEVLRDRYGVGDGGSSSGGGVEVDVDEGVDEELDADEDYDYDDAAADTTDNVQPGPHNDNKQDQTTKTPVNDTETNKEESDVEMQIDSDRDEEEKDGEVSEAPQHEARERAADIETAKDRLLSQLNGGGGDAAGATESASSNPAADADAEVEPAPTALEEEAFAALAADEAAQRRRARANERATLNMILTVAGEFYGQRDLLEFRDPFGGLQVD
ncbi:hypothetical protein GGR52DRAFT_546592 [Hypoxylon sp. FL1284]|nr:hypothetical protein GGR52DRAFT_546592 [Hypoxylon sp. FL1284]